MNDDSQRDLMVSVLLLTVVVLFALVGLATDANWPKMIRVSTAFTGYCAVLLLLSTKFRKSGKTPYWWFFVSGLVAGALSGLVRPSTNLPLVLTQTCAAALFFGGMHWYGVTRVGATLRAQRSIDPQDAAGDQPFYSTKSKNQLH